VDGEHRAFFDEVMGGAPPEVEYVGELERDELWALLGAAVALIMPLRWPEPFGLVVAESLAAGTPVIAWRMGAMPELIQDGVTGRLVDNTADAVRAVGQIGLLSRPMCRQSAENRFSDRVMARFYSAVYSGLLSQTISSRSWATGTVATRIP
jgi:glycosyltransferase involved in cell wall biosynthesis